MQGCARTVGLAGHQLLQVRLRHPAHYRRAGPDGPCLVRCDQLEGGAEHVHVVQVHVREHHELHVGKGVSGVAGAAHACLEDRRVSTLAGELAQGQGQRPLEEGGGWLYSPARGRYQLTRGADEVHDLRLGDGSAVHGHALPERLNVRRDEAAGLVAGGAQAGSDHGSNGALAVRAYHAHAVLRSLQAHAREEGGRPCRRALSTGSRLAEEPVERCLVLGGGKRVHDDPEAVQLRLRRLGRRLWPRRRPDLPPPERCSVGSPNGASEASDPTFTSRASSCPSGSR